MFYYVYKITNKINGKFYIGKRQTNATHISMDLYMGSGIRIKAAIKKYGIENFHKEVLGVCTTLDLLNILEKLEITEDLVNNPNCYNLMVGGRQGPEARKKISESKMGDKNPMKHKVWTDEDRAKKRIARKISDSHRKEKLEQTRLANSPKYVVIFPDGHEEQIGLLTPFCNNHRLEQTVMKAIAHKTHLKDRKGIPTKHKGFMIYIRENL